jgi:alpha-2-macroglobulin
MIRLHRASALTALVGLLASSCGGNKTSGPSSGSGGSAEEPAYVQYEGAPDGIELRVSEGKQGPPAYDRAKLAPARKLPDADTQALLARAAPIAKAASDQQAFALRPASQPPPRTGQTITAAFPPPPSKLLPPAPDAGPGKDLRVLRWMPEGQVPLAPELSVTFSQPMIAVTSQADAAATVPVKLVPQPPGKWRWIGTRTILFDPDVRFPQATTYQVEVPAGTKSAAGAAGAVLRAATKFSFETPPPTLVSSFPTGGHQRLDTPMFALFDQKIDARKVLGRIRATANGKSWSVAPLEPAELDKLAKSRRADHRQVAALVDAAKKNGQDGRWLALRPAQPLPADAAIEVVIPEGTPSAEGPNLTKQAQWLSFRTYPPLRIRSESSGDLAPGDPFGIRFTNPLDAAKIDRKLVTVRPDVPGLRVIPNGDGLVLWGQTTARTRYRVTLSKDITDEFGQKLGRDEEVTWLVGDAAPSFFGPSGVVVLDPAAPQPALDFFSTNYSALKVRLYKVAPSDFDAYRVYLREQWNRDRPPKLPGALVVDRLVQTGGGPNQLTETAIDLLPALGKAGLGHAIAVVEPHPWKESHDPPRMIAWVQSTRLAVDAHVDAADLIAFATELDTGKPAGGIALELRPSGARVQTDEQGTATIPLGGQGVRGAHYLIARRGDDVAFIDDGGYWSEVGAWTPRGRPVQLAWYVVDDRKLYKPGEQVSLKGWLRTIEPGEGGDLRGAAGVASVSYTVYDAQNNQLAKGTAPVNAGGGFDAKITLPKTPNLGHARIEFVAAGPVWFGREHQHVFQIEEFRRPEFEVTAQASQGPFLIGDGGDVTVSAKYYAGGPLPGAPITWNVTASRTSYTPPSRDEYTFGEWEPWWGPHRFAAGEIYDVDTTTATLPYGYGGQAPKTWTLAGKTDATGAHTMHLDFLSVKPAVPMAVAASASVMDVNRQGWSASSLMLVHPSQLYVGLKLKKLFVEKGTPVELDVLGVDLDGKAAPGAKIDVKTVRLDWEYAGGKYRTKEVDPQACPVTAAKEPARCTLATPAGGTYQVTATIVDAKGRPNQTKLTFWVSGGAQPIAREVEQERVQIIPDRKEYAAGTTAELLVQAPFYPAEGLVTWRRSGIVKMERITLDGPTKVIGVPITDAMVPNLTVQVDLVGTAPRLDDKGAVDPKLPRRPAYAVGTIDLPVPPKQRTLAVEVSPSVPKLGPGESAEVAVAVKDAAGQPVAGAEAVVIVVDEAILALAGAAFVSPVDVFYGARPAEATDHYLRGYVKLAKPDAGRFQQAQKGLSLPLPTGNAAPESAAFAPGASAGSGAPMADPAPPPAPTTPAAAPPAEVADQTKRPQAEGKMAKQQAEGQGVRGPAIAMRSNFNPLAAFAPAVKTDAAGRATVRVKVPDNLTRYRIVAIAAAGEKQFGKGESALVARLPLMVRPSAPRFLNFGDTFQLPVVVQNQTDAPMTVKLAARTTNLALTDGAGREVTVPANDRVEVQFPAAAELAGTARLQIVGTAGKASDAAEVALPVWTPATTEAFATYGVVDEGAVKQPVALPGKVVTQFGGLEVTTASTNLQSLTDAVVYLVRYPYECAEQRASRILAIAALRDVLTAFKTKELPSAEAMQLSVAADLERLSQLQNGDGGFPFWERGFQSEPYLTVHVANALARAKRKGFAVSQSASERVKTYLRDIEAHYPATYPKEVRWAISAYALYVRKLLGDVDIAKGQKLLIEAGGPEKVSLETDGWLLGLFAGDKTAESERKSIVRHALNKVSETAGAASFSTSYSDGAHLLLASDHRVDAVMLESLIQEQQDLDLIPKLVTGLLGHRKAGQWLNTQENSFALLAMDLYFKTYEKATPDFVARVWLGSDYAGERAFRGRSTDYFAIPIPMRDVAAHDKQDLTIQKDGAGRLYYRIGMTYAPASLKLDPADHGFVVERRYEGVDAAGDVVRQADGTWKIKAGARVRVRLSMVNESRRYHVALVDPLPAGLEPMNPSLAVTGPIPQDPKAQPERGRYWWWYGPWYEHQNLRDERVEAFASLLWEGVHAYEYVARATTPGSYVVPPPKAEEMYMPETFGRGGSDRVIVE